LLFSIVALVRERSPEDLTTLGEPARGAIDDFRGCDEGSPRQETAEWRTRDEIRRRNGRIFATTKREREREEGRKGRSLPVSGNRLVSGGGSEKL